MSIRTITDAEHAKNIASPEIKNTFLIVVKAHDGVNEVTFCWSLGGYASKKDDAIYAAFKSVVTEMTAFDRQLNDVMNNEVSLSFGSLKIVNENGELDALVNYGFDRREIDIYAGVHSYPHFEDFRLIFSGFVSDSGLTVVNRDEYELTIYDKLLALDVPMQTRRYSSGSAVGDIIPTALGAFIFNVEPVLVDKANLEYQFDEYSCTIIELRVDGNPSTSFTAVGNGKIRLTVNPASAVITADISGRAVNLTTFQPDLAGTVITTASDIIKHLLIMKTVLTINDLDTASFAQFKTDCPQEIQVFTKTDETIGSWYARILSSVNGIGILNKSEGTLSLYELEVPAISDAPDHTMRPGDWGERAIEIESNIIPAKSYTVGYQENNKIQSKFAGVVIDADQEAVALYSRQYTDITYSNTIIEGDLTSILWQSGNTIRYTFAGTPSMTGVAAGQLLTAINADTINNGFFIISGKGNYYVDVTNRSRSDGNDDEVVSGGFADVMIGKYISSQHRKMQPTLLTDATEAAAMSQTKAALLSTNMQVISVNYTNGIVFNMELGETILLNTDDLEPELQGTTGIIIGINEDYQRSSGSLRFLRRVE
jgi:hypothetical protein